MIWPTTFAGSATSSAYVARRRAGAAMTAAYHASADAQSGHASTRWRWTNPRASHAVLAIFVQRLRSRDVGTNRRLIEKPAQIAGPSTQEACLREALDASTVGALRRALETDEPRNRHA